MLLLFEGVPLTMGVSAATVCRSDSSSMNAATVWKVPVTLGVLLLFVGVPVALGVLRLFDGELQ